MAQNTPEESPSPETAQSTPAPAPIDGPSIEAQVNEAFKKSQTAVVRIESSSKLDTLRGTGFFIDPAGTICTHFAVVGDADKITVTVGEKQLTARKLLADEFSGVALLKVDETTSFLGIADPESVKMYTPVMVLGYCRDLPLAPAVGLIAGFEKSYQGDLLPTMHIRATIPVKSGHAGAPVLNLKGEVIGMVCFGDDRASSCYILPMKTAEKIHRDFMVYGSVQYGWVGANVKFDPAHVGAVIERLEPESPARIAGVRLGDELLEIGGFEVRSPGDLAHASFHLTAGEMAKIVFMRDGQRMEVEIKPDLHPALRSSLTPAVSSGSPILAPEVTPVPR